MRSSQGTCDSKGLGDLPTSWKTLKSAEVEMSVFRIWRAICIACYDYTKFGIKVASNASVYTNAKNIHSAFVDRMVFLLVEALPQAPVYTKCVLPTQPFWLRLRDSGNRFILPPPTLAEADFPCFPLENEL